MEQREFVVQSRRGGCARDARGTPPRRAPLPVDPAPPGLYLRVGKPLLDKVIAAVALVVLAPLLALVALAVYTSVGGPIIFGQTRIGRDGRLFTVLKFRSMHIDRRMTYAGNGSGERRSGPARSEGPDRRQTHKSPHDPRLTPTGRLIRRLSLDELPQLINVLRGDMSIVGPRPELPQVVERHYVDWQHRRHAVKPGITGLWQISERGNGMMHEYVDIDLDYVDSVSLLTDVRIMLRTVPAALSTNQGS
ncbi:N/A [soil metagenome]